MKKTTPLADLWQQKKDSTHQANSTWREQIKALYQIGISMEDALIYLTEQNPDWEQFEQWIALRQRVHPEPDTSAEPLPFSDEDMHFWQQNGYIILKGALKLGESQQVQQAIWDYLGFDPENNASWYQFHPGVKGLMLQFSDHPTLEIARYSTRIKKAFEQLYGHQDIYRTIDKVSFNPPETENYRFRGSELHWDVSLAQPIPNVFQALIYLSDCDAHEGAFHCVPGFHHQIAEWIQKQPVGSDCRQLALQNLKAEAVTGRAGDMVIWHQALPHCATPNRGLKPRFAQYLSYYPSNWIEASEWI